MVRHLPSPLAKANSLPDQGRSISRYASDDPKYRALSAKMLAIMLTGLTGTLFIYQGQEIGMINVPRSWPIEDFKDIESLGFYKRIATSTNNNKEALDRVMQGLQILGRDNPRLPMQWDSTPYAGFTDNPKGAWMRVHDLYPEINVARQLQDPDSPRAFWKSMIRLRKQFKEVLIHGTFELFDADNERTFVFSKSNGNQKAVVTLNFTSTEQGVVLPFDGLTYCVGNYEDAKAVEQTSAGRARVLRAWEGRLYMSGR